MTTLEFMEKELARHKKNLLVQKKRNAPNMDIISIEDKIKHYTKVCELLRKEESNASS